MFGRSWRRLVAGVVLGMVVTPATHAGATPCDDAVNLQVPPAQPSERVKIEQFDGRRVIVIVPPGYESTTTRYPVLYLLHGGALNADSFVTWMKIVELTAAQPDHRRAIVVAPDGTPAPFWLDWKSGARKDSTAFTDSLIPWIDATYRTVADPRYRAIAGISAGGLGAIQLAGRRPDLFATVAGFEALSDISSRQPYYVALLSVAQALAGLCYSTAPVDVFGMFGDPVTDEIHWRKVNPPDLAINYENLAPYLIGGSGIPCDPGELADLAAGWFATQNFVVRPSNEAFDTALTRVGVTHTYDPRPCGLHTPRRWDEQIAGWWETMFAAFGKSPPSVFDHRSAEPAFSVWGWEFQTAADRTSEFLSVTDASASGLGLSGSGIVVVRTGAFFTPGQVVHLVGAMQPSAMADPSGRISFGVDLGAAHVHQQYSPPARALEARGGYWVSKTIGFVGAPAAPPSQR